MLNIDISVSYSEIGLCPGPKKQTQSNPIGEAILSEAQRSRMDLAGVLIQPLAPSVAPAKSNGVAERIHPTPEIPAPRQRVWYAIIALSC